MADRGFVERWEQQISSLIRQYRPAAGPEYRNRFGQILSDAVREGRITQDESTRLRQIVPIVEAWIADPPPAPAEAFQQWERLYRATDDRLPEPILEALLRRFPKAQPNALDWDAYLLEGAERWPVQVLLERGLVSRDDFTRLASASPQALYGSVALDVAIERGFSLPRALWDELGKRTARPAGMLSWPDVSLRAYANERSEDADKRFTSVLEGSSDEGRALLAGLLTDEGAASRFCRYLLTGSKSGKKDEQARVHLLLHLVAACNDALAAGAATAPTAALVLGQVRLAAAAEHRRRAPGFIADAAAASGEAVRAGCLRALQMAEAATRPTDGGLIFVLRADELYDILQDYLRTLPAGSRDSQESPERALRFERYQGRKEVLEEVISALGDVPGETELHDAIEVALFNSGVRPLGRIGEQVQFDVHAHQSTEAGVLGGDAVVIVEQGRILGEGTDGVVLAKAKVRRVG